MQVYCAPDPEFQATRKYYQVEAALAWMKENGKKDKAAIATGKFTDITARALKDRRLKKVVNGEEYSDRKNLTILEEIQLAEWIAGENEAERPQARKDIRLKIVEILKFRLKTRSTGRHIRIP